MPAPLPAIPAAVPCPIPGASPGSRRLWHGPDRGSRLLLRQRVRHRAPTWRAPGGAELEGVTPPPRRESAP